MPTHVVALTSGTKISVRPSTRPRATSGVALVGDAALGADELRVAFDTARYVPRDPAAIDDRDRRAVDAVPREADHLVDGGVELGQHLEAR